MPRRSARGRARRPQPGTGVRARRALVLSAALRRLAAGSAPCWRWGSPAWSRRRGSLLSTLRVSHGLLERHLDGVPVGAGVGSVGGDAVLYGGGVLRGELPGLDRLPRHTLSSQQVVGEIEGGHGPESTPQSSPRRAPRPRTPATGPHTPHAQSPTAAAESSPTGHGSPRSPQQTAATGPQAAHRETCADPTATVRQRATTPPQAARRRTCPCSATSPPGRDPAAPAPPAAPSPAPRRTAPPCPARSAAGRRAVAGRSGSPPPPRRRPARTRIRSTPHP